MAAAYQGKELHKMLVTSEHKLKLDPNDAKAHLQFGKVLIGLQRVTEAVPHFDTAARLEPSVD